MKFEHICVIGLGYIGLPTAAMFASRGISVTGVDVSPEAVETINRGDIHIVELGLKDLVRQNVENKRLIAKYEPENADAFLIAVPTPFKKENKDIPEPDLSFIREACNAIAPVLEKGNLIVLESTSPVGTTEMVSQWLSELRPDLIFPRTHDCDADIFVAHCPERVLPGRVIHELVHNDRIIGGVTPRCSEAAKLLYEMFAKAECHITNARTAEMAKLTENASRDVQIAFANELSIICDEQDIDVWELISLANKHPRVNILQPGPGVGGHCIAVDPWFIISKSPGYSNLMHTARQVNDQKPNWVIEKVKLSVSKLLTNNKSQIKKDVTIACFGLAFKANIDDLRESPALNITNSIAQLNLGRVLAVEPNITVLPENINKNIELVSLAFAVEHADLIVLLVEHDEFRSIDTKKINAKSVIDTKGIWR